LVVLIFFFNPKLIFPVFCPLFFSIFDDRFFLTVSIWWRIPHPVLGVCGPFSWSFFSLFFSVPSYLFIVFDYAFPFLSPGKTLVQWSFAPPLLFCALIFVFIPPSPCFPAPPLESYCFSFSVREYVPCEIPPPRVLFSCFSTPFSSPPTELTF